ncbi:MAG: RrF2 family transcriptional regulator [Candidatus Aminicenantia bacterium]
MKISKKDEYALNAMIYLSLNYGKSAVRIHEISKNENIPRKFLEQILLFLKKAGLLQIKPVMGGSYGLSKPTREISLA